MNALNRILLVLILLALTAGAISVIALTWTIPQDSIDWLADAVRWLDDHNQESEKIILSLAAGGIAFLCLFLAIFELLPKAPAEVKVTDLKVGDAVLSTAAIGQRIEEAVSQVANVADARATVKARKRGVLLSLDLHVDPQANLATVTDAACQAANDVLQNRLHVELLEPPHARLHYRELRVGRGPARPAGVVELAPIPATPAAESERAIDGPDQR